MPWSLRAQPPAGGWGWSPPLSVTVTGTEPCRVTPWLRDTDHAATKAGYVFDHVRADPVCAVPADCPEVPGATAACDRYGLCRYWGDDADGDDICDAADRCAGDDRAHGDDDGIPDDCDCDDADDRVFPGAGQACDGVDEDCDGVLLPEDANGAWYHSLTAYVPEWDGEFVVEEASADSRYGKVDRSTTGLTWLDYDGGPVTYLDAGRYLLDFRLAPRLAGLELTVSIDPAGDSGCLERVEGVHVTQGATGAWETTTPLAFVVTRDRCPVASRIWNHDGDFKSSWLFDWSRIGTACDDSGDCPALADGTEGTCAIDGVCTYLPVCL
jgi:hypothetical protein